MLKRPLAVKNACVDVASLGIAQRSTTKPGSVEPALLEPYSITEPKSVEDREEKDGRKRFDEQTKKSMVGQTIQFLDPATAGRKASNEFQRARGVLYSDSSQIEYTPEEALGIVAAINAQIEQLELGNFRRDVWDHEITK